MQFSVNDKVIHPSHGAGRITAIQQRARIDELLSYYVIEIPAQRLTVHVPSDRVEQVGIRLAMPLAKLPGVLDLLRSRAHPLPENHAERQEGIWQKLGTGMATQLAEVVRDLTWHRQQAHLTKKDSEMLKRGREMLAAEMALVSETELAEANRSIDAALAAGMDDSPPQG